MTPEEAIERYCSVFRRKSEGKYGVQFKVTGNFIRRGYVDVSDGWLQWDMQTYTPEKLVDMANRLALGLQTGDPKKPDVVQYPKEANNGN